MTGDLSVTPSSTHNLEVEATYAPEAVPAMSMDKEVSDIFLNWDNLRK
jgi:hypothetical protein